MMHSALHSLLYLCKCQLGHSTAEAIKSCNCAFAFSQSFGIKLFKNMKIKSKIVHEK